MARAGNAARGDGRASGRAPTWRVGDAEMEVRVGQLAWEVLSSAAFLFHFFFCFLINIEALKRTENEKSECFSHSGGGRGGGSFGSVQEARVAHPITWAYV